MINKLYTIKDTIADEFGPLFQAKNDGVASRQFKHLLQREDLDFNNNEYLLYCVGEWNTEDGNFKKYEKTLLVDISIPIKVVDDEE